MGGGGGGGKGGGQETYDNSLELYREQQADLARQRAEEEAEAKANAEAEEARRNKLREQMLGEAIETEEEDGAVIQKNTLA